MPWFITAITKDGKSQRTFGFFNHYYRAYEAIKKDEGSMCECLYDYIVMEYIEDGIHPQVHAEYWWEWWDQHQKWVPGYIGERPEPFRKSSLTNFALG